MNSSTRNVFKLKPWWGPKDQQSKEHSFVYQYSKSSLSW